jgi:hypothetical protein
MQNIRFRSVGWLDKVGVTRQTWTHHILLRMITKPKLLIDSINTRIGWMAGVEINNMFSVFEAR